MVISDHLRAGRMGDGPARRFGQIGPHPGPRILYRAPMGLPLLLIVSGALILYAGAELGVRGASRLASSLGVRAFALAALLLGVDVEGLSAALTAAGRGDTEIAAGVAFGPVLFLFTAGLGLALVLGRRPIPAPSTAMVLAPGGAVVLAALAISDRYVDRFEGLLLLIGYAGYVFLVLRDRRAGSEDPAPRPEGAPLPPELSTVPEPATERPGALRAAAPTVVGLGLLYAGAWLIVEGGARLTLSAGLAAGFVGAAVIGALTSLDEVLLEVLPVRRGVPELATGNLFGTLTAFTTGVLGLAALVRPLTLDTGANLAFLGVAFLYAVVGVTFLLRRRAGWVLGVFLLAFYAAWLVYAAGA